MTTQIMYVQPETLLRLLAQERAVRREDGVAFFRENDHRFPALPLMVSDQVTGNSAHRRVWSPFERRFIFEHVGDV